MNSFSGLPLSRVVDLAQREWIYAAKGKAKRELWSNYIQQFDAEERIAANADSLFVLKARAMSDRYRPDVRRARKQLMDHFPPLQVNETLVSFLRRALQPATPLDIQIKPSLSPSGPAMVEVDSQRIDVSKMTAPESLSARYTSTVVVTARRYFLFKFPPRNLSNFRYNSLLKAHEEGAKAKKLLKRKCRSESPRTETQKKNTNKSRKKESKPAPKIKPTATVSARQRQRRKKKVNQLAKELDLQLQWTSVHAKPAELAQEGTQTSSLPSINGPEEKSQRARKIKDELLQRQDIEKALKVKLEERMSQKTYRRLAAAFPELPREYKLSNEYHKQVQEVQLKVPILPLDENKKG